MYRPSTKIVLMLGGLLALAVSARAEYEPSRAQPARAEIDSPVKSTNRSARIESINPVGSAGAADSIRSVSEGADRAKIPLAAKDLSFGAPPVVWAIIVGIDKPGTVPVAGRAFAREDAIAFHDMLLEGGAFNGDSRRVWLMLDETDMQRQAVRATAENFRKTLQTVANRAAPEDLILFYFKGEGIPTSNGEFRWFFADADPERFAETTILSTEMHELFEYVRHRRVVSLIDVCFETPALEWKRPEDQAALKHAHWPELYNELSGESRIVLSANNGRAPCPTDDAAKHGLFWLVLRDAFEGKGPTDEPSRDAWVSAGEVWQYVSEQLPLRAMEVAKTDVAAIPEIVDASAHDWRRWRLARNLTTSPLIEKEKDELAQHYRDNEISDEELIEGARLLQTMPRSSVEKELRTAYIQFLDGQIPVGQLREVRARALEARRLDPEASLRFAQTVLRAYGMIEKMHVSSNRGRSAVAEGIRLLLRDVGDDVPAKISSSLAGIDQLSDNELKSLLLQVRGFIGKREDFPDPEPLHIVLTGMLESLDPYSVYFDEERSRVEKSKRTGQFAGIGIKVVKAGSPGQGLNVVTPLPKSPAFKAGLRAGDEIVAIDGKDVRKMPFEQADSLLVGKKGDAVKLEVLRNGEPLPFEVKRDFVHVETVVGYHRLADSSWDYWADKENRIGYVRLTMFSDDTATELRNVLRQIRLDGMKSLILDLRYNPGGVLTAAVDVADLFIDDGTIVTEKDRNGTQKVWAAHRWGTQRDFPMAVLINNQSASGSELVAAAIADHDRGIIVGERSFGKGSVQNISPFEGDKSSIKLTTATFHRPNGQNLHRFPNMVDEDAWGVKPNAGYEVRLFREDLSKIQRQLELQERIGLEPHPPAALADDPQLERAIDALKSKS